MNEQDFKDSLRRTMAAHPEPRPMSDAPVLEAAQRDRRRRRALWAGAGSAAAVVAVAVGVVFFVPQAGDKGGGNGNGGLGVGGAPASVAPTEDTTPATVVGTVNGDPQTQWPDGQTDRTASSGPQFDRGVAMVGELRTVVPDGYEAPEDLVGDGDLAGAPMSYHQAQYADTVDGVDVWEYMADLAVTKGDGVGRLTAMTTTPNGKTTQGCALADQAWIDGDCAEVDVDGKKVGVITVAADSDPQINQFEQWAVFRHDDGTVVSVAQSSYRAMTDFPPLDGPIFTSEQLAELAADPRFHLD